jgi:hypothetical protein
MRLTALVAAALAAHHGTAQQDFAAVELEGLPVQGNI